MDLGLQEILETQGIQVQEGILDPRTMVILIEVRPSLFFLLPIDMGAR
jgi:hypothetical protein